VCWLLCQDSRVIAKVNGMIDEYLSQERTVILAVIPANQDIATIDILERAQKVMTTAVPTRRFSCLSPRFES
jgi:hypothetical protein